MRKSASELAIENMRQQIEVLQLAIWHIEEQQQKKAKLAARKPVAVEKAG